MSTCDSRIGMKKEEKAYAWETRIALRGLEDKGRVGEPDSFGVAVTSVVLAIAGPHVEINHVLGDEVVERVEAGDLDDVPGLREALTALDMVLHNHFVGKIGLACNGRIIKD